MLGDLAFLKAMPDADLEFLVTLESLVIAKLREPLVQAYGQAGVPPPQPPQQMPGMGGPGEMAGAGMGAPGGPIPGAQPSQPMFTAPGGTPPGLRREPAMPNPDELRRMLEAG